MAANPPRARWALIPCLGIAGFLGGSSYVVLEAWLNYHWCSPVHYSDCLPLWLGCFGAICGIGVGGSLAGFKRWAWRLLAPPCISYAGLVAILILAGERSPHRESMCGEVLSLACAPAVVLTLLQGGMLELHERRRLGASGPVAAIVTGGLLGPAISAALGDEIFRAAIACGVFVCLTQYYALVAALWMHRRDATRHAR